MHGEKLMSRISKDVSFLCWSRGSGMKPILNRIAGECVLYGSADAYVGESSGYVRRSGRLVVIIRLVYYDAPTMIGGVLPKLP